jgi:hypothetical protein
MSAVPPTQIAMYGQKPYASNAAFNPLLTSARKSIRMPVQTIIRMASAPRESLARNIGALAPQVQWHLAARQQIADCQRSAALLLDHNVAGLYFRLHCLTASMRPVVGVPNGSAEFGGGDHDRCRTLCGGSVTAQSTHI